MDLSLNLKEIKKNDKGVEYPILNFKPIDKMNKTCDKLLEKLNNSNVDLVKIKLIDIEINKK